MNMLKSKHLRVIAVFIFVCGAGSAVFIYLNAETAPVLPLGYDRFASKKYVRELERFGGKFAVLSAELSQWLGGLMHGKSLAVSIGILSLALAALVWYIGVQLPISHTMNDEDKTDHAM
jgi:hypothetical protein